MERQIELVTGASGRTVVWADDRVMLTADEINAIRSDSRHSSLQSSSVWPLPSNYARQLSEARLPPFGPAAFHLAAKTIIKACAEQNWNLVLVDFRTAHRIAAEDADRLWLLDLQNITQSLGYSVLDRSGTTDQDWNWLIYGAQFAKQYNIPLQRFRFCTRYRGEQRLSEGDVRKTEDIVAELLRTTYPELADDNSISAISLRIDNANAQLARQLVAWFDLNTYHRCRLINDAVVFASTPGSAWEHNLLRSGGSQHDLIRKWLGVDSLSVNSAKALFLGHNSDGKDPWKVEVSQTGGYHISRDVLTAVLSKVGMTVELALPAGEMQLPTQAGLPFLLSVRALLYEIEIDPEYYPPKAVTLREQGGENILRVTLNPSRRDGLPIDVQRLADAFEVARTTGNSGVHTTTRRLVDLVYGKVELCHPIQGAQSAFFLGASAPAISIAFEYEAPNKGILITWRAQQQ